ncbi:uncharacterized protein CEXT_742381 [Caerostris extrusa]|uniref:Uncharacterized protein n=1 Tax=Caerostris extrusa TaxID=172846 RepID=A0AAV4Y3T8_CAEEX|nr:uncharacterized protein CEXT_742381 [Caerostris extrusa]
MNKSSSTSEVIRILSIIISTNNWILWLLTQVAFIIWGGFLCLSSLLGCLRLLRSIMKVPLQFLRQVDPGYEITGIMPVDMFAESRDSQPVSHQPRIRITDVNEHTYSYVSEVSLQTQNDQTGIVMSPQRTEAYPLNCLPSSPTHWKPPEVENKQNSPNEDPAVIRPLISTHRSQDEQNKEASIHAISTVQAPTPIQQLSPVAQIRIEDFQFDARKLKRQSRSRLEKQLRRLVGTSALGVALCLLKVYEVFGPHALIYSGNRRLLILPWFCFQTFNRFLGKNCRIRNGLRHGRHEPADIEQPSLLLQQLEFPGDSVAANPFDTIPPLHSISST